MIKAYIKAQMFHLPLEQTELKKQVTERVYDGEEVKFSLIGKMNPVSKVEGNNNIKIEKQKTNIFLLNLLLLVYKKQNCAITEEIPCNDMTIIEKLKELTKLEIPSLFEEIEKSILDFLNDNETTSDNETEQCEIKKDDYEVKFTLEWVKSTHSKLQRH